MSSGYGGVRTPPVSQGLIPSSSQAGGGFYHPAMRIDAVLIAFIEHATAEDSACNYTTRL
jgi:hypothetical protein